jgi:hypothetical protein
MNKAAAFARRTPTSDIGAQGSPARHQPRGPWYYSFFWSATMTA